jgi:chromosome partitioning protein
MNQKGGTGKTTTAVNLSSALTKLNQKILLIDFDPQGNATSNLNINKHEGYSIYDVLVNKQDINTVVEKVVDKLDLIKANISLAKGEQELVFQTARETKFKKALSQIKKKYDYVILDCPPSLGLLTINALCASTHVIIPIETAEFPIEGISDIFDTIEIIKEEVNPNLKIMGILLTKYDSRTSISKMIFAQLKNELGDLLFKSIIKVNIKITEAQFDKKPVDIYAPKCKGALNYKELAEEVLKSE